MKEEVEAEEAEAEGVCRGESCAKGEENLVPNPAPSKDESILSGVNRVILYGSVEESTSDMARVIKRPETFLEQIGCLSWCTARKTRSQGNKDRTWDYKERLQAYRRQEQE